MLNQEPNNAFCLVCQKPLAILYTKTRRGFRVLWCKNCNFARREKIRSKDKLAKIYQGDYLKFLESGKVGGIKKFKSAEERFAEKNKFLEVAQIKKIIAKYSNKKLFEVGFGMGEFLEFFKKAGFELEGCDLSEQCVAFVKKKFEQKQGFELGNFEDKVLPCDYYSVVIIWSVIEHFNNPLEILEKTFKVLQPGGMLLMCGANFNSWLRKQYGPMWPLFSRGHFYFFSILALKKILKKNGFKKIAFYHPKNYKFLSRPNLLKRTYYRLKTFISRGSLIQRSPKFFLVAQK